MVFDVLGDMSSTVADFDNMRKEKHLFFRGKSLQDVKGEKWIQCIMCNFGVHSQIA